ncbi:MAG: response regulator transcription factor [Candidatus Omnitrophica bacterium]|nr:response regulator transcription factor [Candidatus Omnitrophota bacterium]
MDQAALETLHILIVDDDKSIRKFLKTSLSARGHRVSEAATATEALEHAISMHPDVFLLDLGLPDKDGIEVIKELRRQTQAPIIILSVREDEHSKVKALDNGADDYLTKPFNANELLARLRAVTRRLKKPSLEIIFESGSLHVNFLKRLVSIKGKIVHLPPIEYDILKLFIANAGVVLTHRQILREIWNKTEDFEGAEHLLRVTISNLRNKIEPNPDRPMHIHTEPRIGYRFTPLTT